MSPVPPTRRRAFQGAFLGLGAPAGWLLLRWIAGSPPGEELGEHAGLYLYMLGGTVTAFSTFGHWMGCQEQRLRRLSVTDALTGLFNRGYFQSRLVEACEYAARHRQEVSLILVDLDHFKQINDRLGHPSGDKLLIEAAQAMAAITRAGETAARLGGDEFAILLPECSRDAALRVAQRLLEALRQRHYELPAGQAWATASAGLATIGPSGSLDPARLYAQADGALYEAKREGRDRLRAVEPPHDALHDAMHDPPAQRVA